MAQIHEEVIIIKLSKLVKTGTDVGVLASQDIIAALEQVVQELVGDTVIVEVEAA
jgi:hypothetical protein